MATSATTVDWAKLLRDRIQKLSPAQINDNVISNRAVGAQTGSQYGNIGISDGAGGDVYNRNQATALNASRDVNLGFNRAVSAAQPQRVIAPQTGASSGSTAGSAAGGAGVGAAASSIINSNSAGGDGTGTSMNTSAPDSGWQWGQTLNNTPFDYTSGGMDAFGDIAKMNVDNLVGDPNAQRRLWTQHMGGDTTSQMMLGNYIDPETALLLGGGNTSDAVGALKFADALFGHATSAVGDGNGMYNSRDIMGSIVGALKAKPSGAPQPGDSTAIDHLGNQLGAGGDAFTQVSNVLNMMEQSLQFTMSERTYAAYRALIEREGQAFSDWRMTSEGATANMSFGDWLESRLGPNAGL